MKRLPRFIWIVRYRADAVRLGTMRAGLLIVLFSVPALAQWDRWANTDVAGFADNPSPHPLAYFTSSACVAPGKYDRTRDCSASRETADLKLVGHVGKFDVYDLNYSPLNPDQGAAQSVLVSALVESERGVFHEIYFMQVIAVGAANSPTQLVHADGQNLLVERYEDGGQHHTYGEHFFSLSDDGTKLMHPERIKDEAQKQVPENSGISPLSSTINYGDLTWEFHVGPADPWNHPDQGSTGSIIVHFKIESGDFAPKSAEFVPLARAR
jgi:hypothetical protein